jgi:hypothetical protein
MNILSLLPMLDTKTQAVSRKKVGCRFPDLDNITSSRNLVLRGGIINTQEIITEATSPEEPDFSQLRDEKPKQKRKSWKKRPKSEARRNATERRPYFSAMYMRSIQTQKPRFAWC